MYRYFLTLPLLFIMGNLFAQELSPFEKHWFMQNGDTLPYRILLPIDYDPSRKYPLVLFLHGRGESGTDNEKQLTHGARLFLQDSIRKKYPAIVVFPQCRPNSYWSNVHTVTTGSKYSKRSFYFVSEGAPSEAMIQVLALLDNLFVRYLVDRRQVYVMGLSMGGMGTYEIVRRKPKLFAAAIAICGGAHTETAPQIRKTKWWIFHGAEDDIVRPEYSEKMAEALRQAKAEVRLTLYPNANHNSWDPAFAEPALLAWLFSQHR